MTGLAGSQKLLLCFVNHSLVCVKPAAFPASMLGWFCGASLLILHTGWHQWADRSASSCTCLSLNGRWCSFDMTGTLSHRRINFLLVDAKTHCYIVFVACKMYAQVLSGTVGGGLRQRIQFSSSCLTHLFMTLFMRSEQVIRFCRVFPAQDLKQG